MGLEVYTGLIKDMVLTNPEGTDPVSQGDDHVRGVKYTLAQQFEGFTTDDKVTVTAKQISDVSAPGLTQSITDTTAGRITKVGDFGLGKPPAAWSAADLNTLTFTGFHCADAAAPFAPLVEFGIVTNNLSIDPNYAAQSWASVITNRSFNRIKAAGVWSAWREVATHVV